jgi:hypothetical protein
VALDLAALAVSGCWVKHTHPGSPPLPERDPPPDNRWQRGDIIDALYLADSEGNGLGGPLRATSSPGLSQSLASAT